MPTDPHRPLRPARSAPFAPPTPPSGRLPSVPAVDAAVAATAAARHDRLAKPPGSLGRLEVLGARLAAIAARCPPPVPVRPAVVVAAADHGVHAQGISDWPQAVTGVMIDTVASGRAAVNAIARTVGAEVVVVDLGTLRSGPVPPGVLDARVRAGTADLTREPAMSVAEADAALAAGARVARDLLTDGVDLLVLGDLGIGNTTASACLIAAFTGGAPAAVTGTGANRDDRRLARKIDVVTAALRRHGHGRQPLELLASLGGLEHAALVGVILAAASARIPVVLDGVITNAAALVAVACVPETGGYLVAGHASTEPGAAVALAQLGLRPLLDLDLRLGEGTGGLLAVPLVQAAARLLSEVAALDEVLPG